MSFCGFVASVRLRAGGAGCLAVAGLAVALAGAAQAEPMASGDSFIARPLISQTCGNPSLVKGNFRTNFTAFRCIEVRTPLNDSDRVPRPQPEEGAALRVALNEGALEGLEPVEATTTSEYGSTPRLGELVAQCKSNPPLPSIAKGVDLVGATFDLRLERLAIGKVGEAIEVRAQDRIELFDLGGDGRGEKLYALKARSYAETPPSDGFSGWPQRNTDARRADRGILHLFLMPSCRYAGGIVFASRVEVETTYQITRRYPGAKSDGTDLVDLMPITRAFSTSASAVSADLVRVGGRYYFITRHPKLVDRKVTLPSDRSDLLKSEVRAADLDDQGWQRGDTEERLRRAGLDIEITEERPKYTMEIWEIGRYRKAIQITRWYERKRPQSSPFPLPPVRVDKVILDYLKKNKENP